MPVRFSSWLHPRLDWLQVEVTSNCPAACVYCPRSAYRHLWQPRHIGLETFRLLVGTFAKSRMVYLQGWGEPLTHPQLFQMVRLAKEAGCRVGMTTNGMLVDDDTCLRLVQEGVDVVAFSLAGIDDRSDEVRRGTRFDRVVEAVRTLERAKSRLGSARPTVHLAFLLLRSCWQDLEALPTLMQRLKVEHAVISTLDFVAQPDLAAEAILPATEEDYATDRARLEEVAQAGRSRGLSIHYWLASPPGSEAEEGARRRTAGADLPWLVAPPPTCTENIHRSAFVSADGAVSPCAYGAVPAPGATYVVAGRERPYARTSFGNIQEASFQAIWHCREYAHFRATHRAGDHPERCRQCPRLRMLRGG